MNGRAGQQQRRAWLALCIAVGLVVVLYVSASLALSRSPVLMPLDDTYIHFQYARQMALGHPMIYNPGDPATSGGTSLLYPSVLAVGYLVGFTGWRLALWAMAVGALAFFGSAWLVYLIARENPLLDGARQHGIALALALAYAVGGPFVWAAVSGMETALVLFVALLTFYAVQQNRLRLGVIAGVLLTLVRPEGVILSALAMAALLVRIPCPVRRRDRPRRAATLALPVIAAGVQPLVTLIATGTTSASGMQAKSHLYNTGAPLDARIRTILEFFGRMWRELLSGSSEYAGTFTSPLLAELALAGLVLGVWIAWRRRMLNVAVLALVWILALTAAVSTLDTAFWQFKRYQLPVMALFFPAAAWTCGAVADALARRGLPRWLGWALPALILAPALLTTVTFARNYAENVAVVRDQQVPMAKWTVANVPGDARIGVHDVGVLRYFGDHGLYDVVGLTTPGPAAAWRQGPGAVYEHMASSAYRPDYFALYPDVQGLRYLLDAGVFGEVLAEFPVELPPHNVASATDYQAVYRADWSNTRAEEQVAQMTTLAYLGGFDLVDQIDVADLDSEAAHDYDWWQGDPPPGFVTEVYHQPYMACGLDGDGCWATDGGRVLTGGEAFTLHTRPGEDLLLVTRVHGRTGVPLAITVNGTALAARVQPGVPGHWLEVVHLVPGDLIDGTETHVRIEAEIGDPAQDAYMPYYHWAYQGTYPDSPDIAVPLATLGPSAEIALVEASVEQAPDAVQVRLTWGETSSLPGDGIVFVHVYDDLDAPPVAQVVERPMGGVLPPANWLPGVLEDMHTIGLPPDLPAGVYTVAVGLYDARSGERYAVQSDHSGGAGRVIVGEIVIGEGES
ncbi:hypothetical protein [Aggregatilinea lenta]|uniref:hypothetical protein n=1 Tax=Aggregatilinea lenta TaxID=913108 RepID=UPI0013C2D094|nr:hypothetical protein [Aggregatilinea lenta]